ncbi:MAG: lipoyl(octanoyl) transferase LipB [Desulfotalea sp.]
MPYLVDLGLSHYNETYQLQQQIVQDRIDNRITEDVFLVTEHYPVYTLGKRGGEDNLHISKSFLQKQGIDLVQIERGGVITYHGPGQIVVYPIVSLRASKLRVTEYVRLLEEVMIRLCAHFGLQVRRDERNAGVWLENGMAKVGAIGIAIRHGVSFHGLALNVNLDLTPFSWITPCGLTGIKSTSIEQELAIKVCRDKAVKELKTILLDLFGEMTSSSLEFLQKK